MGKKPNIVMIMADQMPADVIAGMGHPVAKTPNIDSLIDKGITFNNCYCNSPLCTPARASLMTGKLVRDTGVYDNGSVLAADMPAFTHHLRLSGYKTVLSGKMHFIGPDQFHGFEERLTRNIYTAGMELLPDWSKGAYINKGSSARRLEDSGVCKWNKQLKYDEKVLFNTLEYIREYKRTEEEQPLFLCSSFTHPHDPFSMTREYWDMYADSDIPLPESEDFEDMHPYNQWIQIHHELEHWSPSEDTIKAARRGYYGMVTYFDDMVGKIVKELETMDMLENTVIIVTSDHGEMLGDHGMWFKRTFYDSATRVPLILYGPDYFTDSFKVNQVVSLADLTATIMEIAKTPEYEKWIDDMYGESLMGLLQGDDSGWKDSAICEYYGEGPIHPMLMLRKGKYKYVHVYQEEPLLFDLEKDPDERENLAGRTVYREIEEELKQELLSDIDLRSLEEGILKSQQQRKMMVDALGRGVQRKWDLEVRLVNGTIID